MVENKINVRANGPRDPVTNQPTQGRKRHGGLTVDRMGVEAISASGAGELNRMLHLKQGSEITVGFCKKCHCTLCYKHGMGEWICPQCKKHSEIIIRKVPPAATLLGHIFEALHLSLDYIPHDEKDV